MKALGVSISCRDEYGFLIPREVIQDIQKRMEQGRDKGHTGFEDGTKSFEEEMRRVGLHLANIQDTGKCADIVCLRDNLCGAVTRLAILLAVVNGYKTKNRRTSDKAKTG